MKRVIILGVFEILIIASCSQRKGQKVVSTASIAPKAVTNSIKPFQIDSLTVSGPPYRLCNQRITSEDGILSADSSTEGYYSYDREATPIQETFFFPEKDIANTELVQVVQLRYNYANVLYRIQQGYELFVRKSSGDTLTTRQDSLDLIIHDCPVIPSSLLQKAIPDKNARMMAVNLLSSYRMFDGRENSNSAFDNTYAEYVKGFDNLPEIVEDSLLTDFENHFWEWYDKRRHVPEYDRIVALYIKDTKIPLTKDDDSHLKAAIEGERDIDRRTILSLELFRSSSESFRDATIYLGEILESGIYTKYILEAWLAWRAGVQLEFHSPSSFSVIPNNYYDKIRVKCLNTILRHIQLAPDKYDVCLLENFVCCEILHRMDAIYGNEAMTVITRLTNGMFIQPSALGKDYLNED